MNVMVNIVMTKSDLPFSTFSTEHLYYQRFDWTAVPRVGDAFLLCEKVNEEEKNGWTEEVERVFWSNTGEVQVELGKHTDRHKEGLEALLLEYGWQKQ